MSETELVGWVREAASYKQHAVIEAEPLPRSAGVDVARTRTACGRSLVGRVRTNPPPRSKDKFRACAAPECRAHWLSAKRGAQ
jgi:hypothetical protein